MHYSKRSLGQNFLIDNNIVKKIVKTTDVYNKNILEIGPGKGALTEQILKSNPKSLILIEKDNALSKILKKKYRNDKRVKIYNNDILKLNFEDLLKSNSVIFGNLPYNISSQVLVKIIKFKKKPLKYSSLILMFQKEMADRITAKFGASQYGRLSILSNYKLKIFDKFNVSPNCFYPKPKVNSTVLYLKPNERISYKIENIQNLDATLFLDVANIWGVDYDSSIDKSNKIRSSIGLGLDWFSVVGPINFSLTESISKAETDITESFRFNIGTTF